MDSVSFIVDNSVIKFHLSKKLFQKIPDDKETIYNDLFNNHKYYVQSKVRKEIFQAFLEYWSKGTFPEINSSNILEYYQLNIEFGFFEEYFSSEKIKEPVCNLSYLLVMKENGSVNINDIERKIALNLDVYLDDLYSKDFCKLPVTSLYNIFYHPERNLKSQDKAYQFIVESGEDKDQNFYILLCSLDAEKFAEKDNKRDCVYNKDKHFGFAPKNYENSIDKIENENKNLFEQLKISKKNVSELQIQLKDLKQQNSDYDFQLNNSKKQISELGNQLNDANKEITELKKMLQTQLQAISDCNNKNNVLSSKLTTSNNKIEDLENQLKIEKQKNLDFNLKFKDLDLKIKNAKNISFKIYLTKYQFYFYLVYK